MTNSNLIWGKNKTPNIVSINVDDSNTTIFTEAGGAIDKFTFPASHWILFDKDYTGDMQSLEGGNHYMFVKSFSDIQDYKNLKSQAWRNKWDYWSPFKGEERLMIHKGFTYYKGMKFGDVSTLSFDIETTGMTHDINSKVLLISNTFKYKDVVIKKLFAYDDFNNQKEMIYAWCKWVQEVDPSIILGHNVFGFDFPYLQHIVEGLPLGRDGSLAEFDDRVSQFRKDGSQTYDYNNVKIFGREIIDTFFLSIKYDVQRKYPSYKLKEIIKYEGLVKDDRQYYDAGTIRDNYTNPVEWEKIKRYAIDDADEALALYELMAPSFFYYTQHLPKSFQTIINTATGSQVNSFLLRSYLQEKHSIPKSSETIKYEGGISFGEPGIYTNINKVDVASLYPSIILKDGLYDKEKDPKAYFLKMVHYFTTERLNNKKLAATTQERYYKDLEQSQKIFINSAYGFMGANRLHFNSPKIAESITREGRRILKRGIDWAISEGYTIVNADTDSFSYSTGRKLTPQEIQQDIDLLNKFDEGIVWEDDGQYDKFIVVKAKNYILKNGDKLTIKGSSLKATMKEKALKEMINDIINSLLNDNKDSIIDVYDSYVRRALKIDSDSIDKWVSKKTITKAVLLPKRTTEQRIKDAIDKAVSNGAIEKYQEGDKVFVFFENPENLMVLQEFNGTIDKKILMKKIYKTVEIFKTIIDISDFPKYYNKKPFEELINAENKQTRTGINSRQEYFLYENRPSSRK